MKTDGVVDHVENAVAGFEVMLIEPATDAVGLELIMKTASEGLVGVAVADKGGVELYRKPNTAAVVFD